MKAGGITVIACYVPWLHHVPERGAPDFTGNLDVAAFVDEVRAAGLEPGSPHRPVGPRRDAQRRVPRLGAGRFGAAPHR